MNFPTRLRELRREKKLSQSELAKLVGLHYTQIGRYERGLATPTSEVLVKMAKAFDVSVGHLLEGDEEKNEFKFSDPELFEQFKQVDELSNEDKEFVKVFVDAFLTKKKLQTLVR